MDAQTTTLTVGRDPLDAGQIALVGGAEDRLQLRASGSSTTTPATRTTRRRRTISAAWFCPTDHQSVRRRTSPSGVRDRHQHRDLRGPVGPDRLLIDLARARGDRRSAGGGGPHPGIPASPQETTWKPTTEPFNISQLAVDFNEARYGNHVMAGGQPTDWKWTFAGPGHPNAAAQSNRVAREFLAKTRAKEQAQTNGKKWKARADSRPTSCSDGQCQLRARTAAAAGPTSR